MKHPFQILRHLFVAFLWLNALAIVYAALFQVFMEPVGPDLLDDADSDVLWWYAAFLYAASAAVVVVIALSPVTLLAQFFVGAVVIPDTLDEFGKTLCNEVLTKSVISLGEGG